MFAKNSRYYKLENSAELDARGQVFEAKILRVLPDTPGQFQHIVEGSDRLDTLAYKYYQDSPQWWRLCDANPEFHFPTDLIGKSPLLSERFTLQWDQNHIPWSGLAAALSQELGIEKVQIGTQDQAYPDEFFYNSSLLFIMDGVLETEIDASVLAQLLTPALDQAFQDAGYTISASIQFDETEPGHWELLDIPSQVTYSIQLTDNLLYVSVGFVFSMNAALLAEIDASIRSQELSAALALPFQISNNDIGLDIRLETISSTEWRLQDLVSKIVYTLRFEAGVINVYRSTIRAIWSITVSYNRQNISSESVAEIIEGFAPTFLSVLSIDPIHRIGKPIIIPPKTTA